jgi:peptidoglycan/LPS O-acetylase OafA/YrhL
MLKREELFMECEDVMETKGIGWRVSLSIIAGIAWLVFIILWLFFYAGDYNWEKNVSIILLSILIVGLVLGAPWCMWGLRHRKKKEVEMWKTKGFKWRVILSTTLAFLLIAFLIIWFWFYAEPYDVYQNIAILVVSILIAAGIMGASWAPWGMKHHRKFEHEHLKDIEDEIEKRKNEEKDE